MKGRGDRPARVGERIREELCLLLLRKVNDPGLAPITVTEVSVTPDLRIAHVNYSALVAPEERPAVAKALRRSSGFLRRELGHLLGLSAFTFAELALDRCHLLTQQNLALALVQGGLGLTADSLR